MNSVPAAARVPERPDVLEVDRGHGDLDLLEGELGHDSIEFQQTVQREFQQSFNSYRVSCTQLKILLNILLKFS